MASKGEVALEDKSPALDGGCVQAKGETICGHRGRLGGPQAKGHKYC